MKAKYEIKIPAQFVNELNRLSNLQIEGIIRDSTTEVANRARHNKATTKGGTPVDTGELRLSVSQSVKVTGNRYEGEVGYSKSYAPHVEYGHRTRSGGFVQGQHFLRENMAIEEELMVKRVKDELKGGK